MSAPGTTLRARAALIALATALLRRTLAAGRRLAATLPTTLTTALCRLALLWRARASLFAPAFALTVTLSFARRSTGSTLSTGSARTSRSGARAAPIHRHGHWWERGGNCVHWRRETFDGHRNFFDLAGFIGQVEAHEYQLREDLAIEHEAITFGGADAALAAGESLLEFVVSLIFVAQAAHEAAAPTADLERVEGGLLVFGRLHADGLEDLEEVLAAAVLAALFVVGGEACFVACADGLHLDACLVLGGESVDEFAQVDAIFGHVVEHDALAAEQWLGVDDLGGQADAFGVHARVHLEFVARLLEFGLLVHVFHGGDAQHAAIGEEGIVAAAAVVDVLEHLLA